MALILHACSIENQRFMKKNRGGSYAVVLALICAATAPVMAQDAALNTPTDWFLRDPETDSLQGVSSEKTYTTLLKGKPSRTVLVAVIDSGIDIDHEDLKDIIWTNEDEIPANGVDDDKNGYIDDIHGWNFIGGKTGNVDKDTYEVTREYARLKPKYENFDSTKVNKKNKAEFAYWKKVKAKYDEGFEKNKGQLDLYSKYLAQYQGNLQFLSFYDSLLEVRMGKPVTKSSLTTFTTSNDTLLEGKEVFLSFMDKIQAAQGAEGEITGKDVLAIFEEGIGQLNEAVDHFGTAVEYGYNITYNPRPIVGDNPANLTEKGYGNSDVEGPDPLHGTHVAGIYRCQPEK
jgi:cell wall-associated protease